MDFDWSKVKAAIGTVAPWIAGTLGSPVAGVATKAFCDVFGLAGDSVTPDNITAALAGASPEQLQALHDADNKHAEFMQSIGYDHQDKIAQAVVDDRNGARDREKTVKDRTPSVLAALAVLVFLALIGAVAFGFEPKQSMQAGFWMLAGAAIAVLKDVYGYYFGSSAGSQSKDATIAAQAGVGP